MIKKLLLKFNSKNLVLGVIGLGYVGLPICEDFQELELRLLALITILIKLKFLKKGLSYIKTNKLKNFKYF